MDTLKKSASFKKALLIFVKRPVPGRVKTRLAGAVGPRKAARIYRDLARRTLESAARLANRDVEIVICYDPPGDGNAVRRWLGPAGRFEPQKGTTLGSRLRRAVSNAFSRGPKRVVVIGSDCPAITPSLLDRAFRRLARGDIVLGPAEDGGYYLIGLRKNERRVFRSIPWSSPCVLEKTLDRIREARLSFSLLPVKRDIDTYEDLRHHSRS